ncbi:MAG: YraN family protein [Vampirovibrionales bacterium]
MKNSSKPALPLKTPKPTHNQDLGLWGENIARHFLERKGFRMIDARFRVHQQGEIDLIAYDQQDLVFVEVKTRHTKHQQTAYEALTPHKKKALLASIDGFLAGHEHPYEGLRVDWVIVTAHPADSSDGDYATLDHVVGVDLY